MVDEKIINRLRKTVAFKTQEDVDEFLALIDQIDTKNHPDYLPYLFEFFNDDCDIEGVDEAIRLAIEDCPTKCYIPCLLENLKSHYSRVPESFRGLVRRAIYFPEWHKSVIQNINLADRETLLKVLKDIEDDEPLPEHVVAIQELRKLLNSDDLIYADK